MADGAELAAMVDAEEARVIEEEGAEAEAQAQAEEQHAQEQHAQRVMYHLGRFLELTGRELPENGVTCPTCGLGIVDVEMRNDPEAERCEQCNGLGRTLTGSLVPGNADRVCPGCNGQGYRATAVVPAQPPLAPDAPQIPVIPYTPVPTAAVG